jgi:hypothetical protein
MHLNSTHLVRSGERQLLQKRGIFEAEVMDADIQAAAPLLVRVPRSLCCTILHARYW